MKKIKLTESQARKAIRNWIFEYSTDSGVSHRPSTDDKIAGKLGDDRNNQPSSTIPNEIPIIPMNQMANQLSVEAPPVEDVSWMPVNSEELARAAHQLSTSIPAEEIEWYYKEVCRIREEAINRANKISFDDFLENEEEIKSPIRIQAASKESSSAANETKLLKRWMKILLEGTNLKESWYNKPGKMTRRMKTKKLTQRDMMPTYPKEEEIWEDMLDQADYDDFGFEGSDEDIEDFVRSSNPNSSEEDIQAEIDAMAGKRSGPGTHNPPDKDPDAVDSDFDDNAKLRQLRDSGVIPNVSTLSGTKKWITANVDAFVAMWFNANQFTRHLQKFIRGESPWGPKSPLNGPKIYLEATEAAGFYTPEEIADLREVSYEDLRGGAGGTYSSMMNTFVTAPILAKWKKEVAAGNITADSFVKGQINHSDFGIWIKEAVIDKWNTGRAKRQRSDRAKAALNDHADFLESIKSPIFYEYDPSIPKDADAKIDDLKDSMIEKLEGIEES